MSHLHWQRGKTEGWHLNQAAIHDYLKNKGTAIVIFDGLDEIFPVQEREQITRQIVGFASDYSKARIIVTSRAVGYRSQILKDMSFAHFTVQDLTEEQVAEFVERWYQLVLSDRPDEAKHRRERIMQSFRDSLSIRQLAGNPMLLTILAIIGRHQELPRERWKLYDHAINVLVQHWDVNKHLEDRRVEVDFIDQEDKKELLRRLAYKLQAEPRRLVKNHLHREELQIIFETYLKDRYGQTQDRAKVTAEVMIQHLRERNFILGFYGANLYGFIHRAFLEYFCAAALVHKFEKTQEITLEELKSDVFRMHQADESWHEVLCLICSMIDQKFSGEIIDDLVGEAYQLWREEFGDRLPWNILLATHCLAEVRNISSLSEPANKILKAVCTLFDKKEGLKFVEDRMLSSIERIGTNWPHRDTLAKWLMEWDPKGIGWFSAPTVGAFIGGIGGGSDEVHRAVLHYGQHENKNYRVIAPSALGRGWHNDPSTLPLLRKWAEYDGDEDVRRAALIALGTYFRSDVQSRALLLDRSRNDPSKYVRWIAMVVASMAFGNSPEASNLLKDRAINDKEEIVRSSALDYLRLLFASEPHTIPFLCDRARSDFDSSARFGALYGLVENFREHPETISLLLNRAVNDVKESVRSLAISTLIEHFALDAHIASLIRDRLENDPSENLRNHVRELMQKFSIL